MWWFHGALHAVAQVQAERSRGTLLSFREMQAQAREVDRRRVAIAVRMAELARKFTAATQVDLTRSGINICVCLA